MRAKKTVNHRHSVMGNGQPAELRELVERLLTILGEDPSRNGLLKTPERVEKALQFMTQGYRQNLDQILNQALFPIDYDEMVIVKDIEFFSLCEHHILPFFGRCHVAYIPNGKVIGLSKLPRIVDVFARRLQLQERMTNEIAETIRSKINPLGVAVVCEGTHLCMSMRGVEKQNSFAVTSAMLGIFRDNARTRSEFLELIKRRGEVLQSYRVFLGLMEEPEHRTDVLAHLLGWRGTGPTAVALDFAEESDAKVTGLCDFVAHAQVADRVLVAVEGGRVVEVDARGDGVLVEVQATIGDDGRGRVTLDRAPVLSAWTCDVEGAVARAAIVLAADAVGAAEAALDAAVAHVKQRRQWGAPLGTLQAVQHRAADMLIDVTLAADAVLDAAGIADRATTTERDVRLAAAYAKATAVERCRRVTAAAHQLAGGQGILADAPFHRWYRRVKAAEPVLGDNRHHRAVIAASLLDR